MKNLLDTINCEDLTRLMSFLSTALKETRYTESQLLSSSLVDPSSDSCEKGVASFLGVDSPTQLVPFITLHNA